MIGGTSFRVNDLLPGGAVLRSVAMAVMLLCLIPTGQAKDYSESNVTKVVLLGTGTPMPDPRRRGPSVAVVVNGQPYFVDAGEGVWRAAGAATPLYGGTIEGLRWGTINTSF